MPRAHANRQSRGTELGNGERKEDAVSESSIDNSSSSAVLVAGVVLVGLFVAPQLRNLLQNRRKRKRRIQSSLSLWEDTCGLKHELNTPEYSFSISDMDSASDDHEGQVPLPSPWFGESRLSMQGFELDYSEVSEEIDNVAHIGNDGWQRQKFVVIERVKNLVYRRRVVDGGRQKFMLSTPILPTNSRRQSFQDFSHCLDEPKEWNRNTNFMGSLKCNGGLVELL